MLNNEYIQNFKNFVTFLEINKIDYCVIAGTLLGTIREHDFITYDHDIDISIKLENKEKLQELLKNTQWTIVRTWRREIAIKLSINGQLLYKIDIFFIESDKKNTYLYSYKKNNLNGNYEIEWRMKFPKKCFKKFKKAKIGNISVSIPNNAKELLTLEYDKNWKIRKSNWLTYDAPAYDKNYREIGIIIPTFLRDTKMKITIDSIQKNLHTEQYRIYIAEQGKMTEEKKEYYKQLESKGHKIYYIPYDCGLSYARNYLIQQVVEPFILLMDDDMLILNNTDISKFIEILITDEQIGVVGGCRPDTEVYHYNLTLNNEEHKLYYSIPSNLLSYKTINQINKNSIRFGYCDCVANFALFRKELFNTIIWDNNLKLIEHTDFYLRLKQTNWKVAFTNEVYFGHQNHNTDSIEYKSFRGKINGALGLKLFLEKWQIPDKNHIVKPLPLPIIKQSEQSSKIEIKTPMPDIKELTNILFEIINILDKKNIYLSKMTCLQSVKNHTLSGNKIYLSTTKITEDKLKELELKGYKYLENEKIFIKDNCQIILDNKIPKKFKLISLFDKEFKVPYPVHGYLYNLYGSKWKENDGN